MIIAFRKNRLSPGFAHGRWFWVPNPSSFDESSEMILLSTDVLEPGPVRRTFLHCLEAVISQDTNLSARAKTLANNAAYEFLAAASFGTAMFNPVKSASVALNSRRVPHPFHRYVAVPCHWVYTTEGVGKLTGRVAINALSGSTSALSSQR